MYKGECKWYIISSCIRWSTLITFFFFFWCLKVAPRDSLEGGTMQVHPAHSIITWCWLQLQLSTTRVDAGAAAIWEKRLYSRTLCWRWKGCCERNKRNAFRALSAVCDVMVCPLWFASAHQISSSLSSAAQTPQLYQRRGGGGVNCYILPDARHKTFCWWCGR